VDGVQLLADRYRLVERLGLGGMSVVWRAYDEVLGRQVAVKMLNGSYATDGTFRGLIRAEARAAARLSHPHVTNIYDYGEWVRPEGRLPFVVMELVEGPTLSQRLARGPLPWRTALRLCAEVASALSTAHARGLVHRDEKPANILLTPSGAKVVDFGIAAVVGAHADSTADRALLGTPAYLAPERLTGGPVTAATDVYGLGLLIYQSLTGNLPWRARTATELISAHRDVEPAPMPSVPGLPHQVVELCRQCLSREPADRPTSTEVARALGAAVRLPAEVHPPVAEPMMPLSDLLAPDMSTDPFAQHTTILPGVPSYVDSGTYTHLEKPPRARHSRIMVVAACVLVAVVAGGAEFGGTRALSGHPAEAAAAGGWSAAAVACDVRYHARSDSAGSFAVDLAVTNTGAQPLHDWTLAFSFPSDQSLVRAAGARWSQAGRAVTLQGSDSTAPLASHAVTAVTLTGTYQTANLLPTAFTLNGTPCTPEVSGTTSAGATTGGGSSAGDNDGKDNDGKDKPKGKGH
jgi:serine/threonine protein kinase